MPSVSPAQRRLFGLAEHDPSKLNSENKGLANLPHQTLHDFASTHNSAMPTRSHMYGYDGGKTAHMEDGGSWIEDAASKPGFQKGKLTSEADAAGQSPMTFARKHYGDPGAVGRRARFAVNAQK